MQMFGAAVIKCARLYLQLFELCVAPRVLPRGCYTGGDNALGGVRFNRKMEKRCENGGGRGGAE